MILFFLSFRQIFINAVEEYNHSHNSIPRTKSFNNFAKLKEKVYYKCCAKKNIKTKNNSERLTLV